MTISLEELRRMARDGELDPSAVERFNGLFVGLETDYGTGAGQWMSFASVNNGLDFKTVDDDEYKDAHVLEPMKPPSLKEITMVVEGDLDALRALGREHEMFVTVPRWFSKSEEELELHVAKHRAPSTGVAEIVHDGITITVTPKSATGFDLVCELAEAAKVPK